MSSLTACNAKEDAMQQQLALQEEYIELHTKEMRSKLDEIPYAFPRVDKFPAPWKVIYPIVYDFMSRLGLQNTLAVYAMESEMGKSFDILETGWFLKSFIMYPNFHSVMMFLLEQFNLAGDRISTIIDEEQCRAEAGRCTTYLSDSVREQKARDAERSCEAQRMIGEQRDKECSMKEAEFQSESECRRQEEKEKQEEMCRLQEIQLDMARREAEAACANNRDRIIDDIKTRHCQQDVRDMCARAGMDMNSNVSRRRSFDGGCCNRRSCDPRQNKSFGPVNRSQHSGWKIEPLGEMGPWGSDPDQAVAGEVWDGLVQEEDSCSHQPQRTERPSLIPRIYQERVSRQRSPSVASQQSNHHHHLHPSPNRRQSASRRRSNPRSRASIPAQTCSCRQLAQDKRREREAEDYIHFSRRQPSRRRQSVNVQEQQGGLDCIREQ